MHVPITLFAVALLTAGMAMLRARWERISTRLRGAIVGVVVVFCLLWGLSHASKWETSLFYANALLNWARVVGYEFLLMRFSLVRPRRITIPIAVLLLLPVLGASVLLPLTDVFERPAITTRALGTGYVVETRLAHKSDPVRIPEVEVTLYHQPRALPMLRRIRHITSFTEAQCNTRATTAVADSTGRRLLIHCPAWPDRAADDPWDEAVPLP